MTKRNPLEAAFGIGRKIDPVDAIDEVASALESNRLPSRDAAQIVARAIRKCLDGTSPAQRDLLVAAGWQNRPGGRFETPAARKVMGAKAKAAAAAIDAAPGATAKARASHVAQSLALSNPANDQPYLDALRQAGIGPGATARTLQNYAKRARDTSI